MSRAVVFVVLCLTCDFELVGLVGLIFAANATDQCVVQGP